MTDNIQYASGALEVPTFKPVGLVASIKHGIGIADVEGNLVITTIHADGTALGVVLNETALDAFSHLFAKIIEQRNARTPVLRVVK